MITETNPTKKDELDLSSDIVGMLANEFKQKATLYATLSSTTPDNSDTESNQSSSLLDETNELSSHLPGLFATVLGDDKNGLTPINSYSLSATNQFDGRLRRRNLVDTDISGLTWLLRSSSMRVRAGTVFSRLTELDLSRNCLTTLPDGLCRATPSLTKLNLAHNRITQCPLSLSHLTSLEELNLTGNQLGSTLDSLPGWLFRRWPQLRVLRLSDNKLEKLPSELVQLTLLEVLELGSVLGGNRLKSLPAGCLARLRNLVDLDLTDNELTELDLSDDFCNHVNSTAIDSDNESATILPALSYLTLTDNQITSLPAALAECNRLRSLRIDGNRLTSLPTQLIDLANLELLDVARNQLSVWPAELDELAQRGCTVILAQNPFDKQLESTQNRRNNVITPAQKLMESTNHSTHDMMSSAQPSLHASTNTDNRLVVDDSGRQSPIDIRALSMLPAVTTETARPITAHVTVSSNGVNVNQNGSYYCNSNNSSNISSNNNNNNHNTMMTGFIGNGPPSLLELAARVLLHSQQPIPYHALPDHLVTYLSGGAHACAWCHGPFVGEWIGCLRQGHFGGHGVHRWLRYCSRSCQSSAADEASRIAFKNMSQSSKHHRRIVGRPMNDSPNYLMPTRHRGHSKKNAFICYAPRPPVGRCLGRNANTPTKHDSSRDENILACARWRCLFDYEDTDSIGEDDDNVSVASSNYDTHSIRSRQSTNLQADDDSWCDPMACAPVRSAAELAVSIDTNTASPPTSSPLAALSTDSPMPAAPYSPLAIFLESRKRKSVRKASRLRCDTRYLDW